MSRLLVIDDDKDWLLYVKNLLEHKGHEVLPLLKTEKLEQVIATAAPDLIITDILMPGMSGSTVYGLVRERFGKSIPIVVCSSTRLQVKSDDPLLEHVRKSAAHEALPERVHSLLTLAVQHAADTGNSPLRKKSEAEA